MRSQKYQLIREKTIALFNFFREAAHEKEQDSISFQAGKGDSVRARAILRSLISLDDLGHILSLRFAIPNLATPTDGMVLSILFRRNVLRNYLIERARKTEVNEDSGAKASELCERKKKRER